MTRILFLTQVLPYPLDAGPKVRAYHMLRHLAARHEVTLVSFVRSDDTPEAVGHLRGICAAVHTVPIRRSPWRNLRAGIKGIATGLPVVIARDEMAEMAATLRRLASETPFDVIHADQLSMAGYGQMAVRSASGPLGGPRRPRAVLDEHNAVYVLARRIAQEETGLLRRTIAAREAAAFARYEAAMCRDVRRHPDRHGGGSRPAAGALPGGRAGRAGAQIRDGADLRRPGTDAAREPSAGRGAHDPASGHHVLAAQCCRRALVRPPGAPPDPPRDA